MPSDSQLRHDALRSSAPIKVLDKGFVRFVDCMGGDGSVVRAARVSYGVGTKTIREDRGLIRYLLRMGHTSPFEHATVTFHVKIPMDAWRQGVRHRTASVNEASTRYSVASDDRQTTPPDAWRAQALNAKQGSSGKIIEWPDRMVQPNGDIYAPSGPILGGMDVGRHLSAQEERLHILAGEVYRERLALGVAREQARKDLPLSTYTELYWTWDAHNLMHFLRLRLDRHAQYEIRQYAKAMSAIMQAWMPITHEAFEDYVLGGVRVSAMEAALLRAGLGEKSLDDVADAPEWASMTGRERRDFAKRWCHDQRD